MMNLIRPLEFFALTSARLDLSSLCSWSGSLPGSSTMVTF